MQSITDILSFRGISRFGIFIRVKLRPRDKTEQTEKNKTETEYESTFPQSRRVTYGKLDGLRTVLLRSGREIAVSRC